MESVSAPVQNHGVMMSFRNYSQHYSFDRRSIRNADTEVHETQLWREWKVEKFVFEGEDKRFREPLIFRWMFSQEDSLCEIIGTKPYQDIMVYGDSLECAVRTLEQEILPYLWKNYANENDVRLSYHARLLKEDLLRRILF